MMVTPSTHPSHRFSSTSSEALPLGLGDGDPAATSPAACCGACAHGGVYRAAAGAQVASIRPLIQQQPHQGSWHLAKGPRIGVVQCVFARGRCRRAKKCVHVQVI